MPLWFSFTAGSVAGFLGLFALSYGIFVASQAPILSLLQSCVEPAQRGFAIAFALFFNNLIGQLLSAALIGLMSDRLSPGYGPFGLNLAVFGVCVGAAAAAMAIFAWAAVQMRRTGYIARLAAG